MTRIRERQETSPRQWLTGSLRRAAHALRRARGGNDYQPPSQASLDWWLGPLYHEKLSAIDAACADRKSADFALFRDLDDDLWAVLLSRDYAAYPNIRALLPSAPAPDLQQRWNGTSGLELLRQSKAFYAKARGRFAEHGSLPLSNARVLDFGCGWGRLTRFFARDVQPGSLYACDPVNEILDICRRTNVPATIARSEFVPERLPFSEQFDLVFSFSVFTHLSERAHQACLRAIHTGLAPGGIFIATIRSPAYLHQTPLIRAALDSLGPNPLAALAEPRYLFVAHGADPNHPQYAGGEMDYGETVITLPYLRRRWGELFELLDISLLTGDMHQVVLTLRRR